MCKENLLSTMKKKIEQTSLLLEIAYYIVQWAVNLVVFLQHFCNSSWTVNEGQIMWLHAYSD